jgi:hypothetical protein
MIPNLIDQVFGTGSEEPPADEFYPGSRRKLAAKPSSIKEFRADPWRENFTIKVIHGVEYRMYTVGALANALGVSVSSIRDWTRKSHLPVAPYRLPSNMVLNGTKVAGRRLYTEPMIEAAVASFEKRGLLGLPRIEWAKHSDLPIEIREAWSRIFHQTAIQPNTSRST